VTTAQNGIGSQTEPCLSLCCLIISITFCRSLLEFSSCSNHTILSEYASPVSRIASSDQTNTTTLATRMQQCKYSNTVNVVKTQSKSRTAFQPALSYLAHTNLTILDIHYWLLDLWKSAAACESDLLSLIGDTKRRHWKMHWDLVSVARDEWLAVLRYWWQLRFL